MPIVVAYYVPNAPNLIEPNAFGGSGAKTVAALRELDLLERFSPEAIVVSSPHWSSRGPFLVQASPQPRQIYDFSGFPPELSEVRYRPPGDPTLARALVDEGTRRGIGVEATETWGLDHGAWAPLLHLAPGATVPVVPTSISPVSGRTHAAWGEAVSSALAATTKRVVVVGTGSILHRLDRMGTGARWEDGARWEAELVDLALHQGVEGLTTYDRTKWRALAPEGELGPLFFVLGAAGPTPEGRLVATDQAFGAAGLSVLEFLPR